NRLHFLGGVAGWGFPFGKEGEIVMTVTVHFSDGQRETLQLKNGVEFADYIREVDVPGSKLTKGLVKENQLRWFTKSLQHTAAIDRLTLESSNTLVAPTTVAITAELADANSAQATADAAPKTPPTSNPPPARAVGADPAGGGMERVRALAVGGGSSHDFKRWFGDADKATLLETKPAWLDYVEKPDAIPEAIANLDVLILSTNQRMPPDARKAIVEFARAGKGLLLIHPALWYNWADFPEYNRDLVGGGAKSHDKYGEFEVEVLVPDHPLMAGLPRKFKITDELYHSVVDAQGAHITVLAQATSPVTGKTFPQIWITQHPNARIACITLGHDGKAHELPEFKTLLKNAFRWVARKEKAN
ncbi:MAG TPA: ThuA domain-containing protein, partial [Chthoniobacteraceae bacterium]|nr:ThuA domain-containing protein [Chthoniobacteraceae bacterium]